MHTLPINVNVPRGNNGADVEVVPLMICPDCFGKGGWCLDIKPQLLHLDNWFPCDECGGCGVIHCCEGNQARPCDESLEQKCLSPIEDPPTDHLDPTS